jgi:hypothetical protein
VYYVRKRAARGAKRLSCGLPINNVIITDTDTTHTQPMPMCNHVVIINDVTIIIQCASHLLVTNGVGALEVGCDVFRKCMPIT